MRKTVKAGQAVVFVDANGVPHDALLTYLWPANIKELPERSTGTNQEAEYDTAIVMLMVNLVIIKDEAHHDYYGNQIEHQTSVGHKSQATAQGYFWHERE